MIERTTIRLKRGAKISNPIMIVGLPGVGNVGKLVAEHLKRQFKAQRIGTIYSPHFPHQVVMLSNGRVRIVNNRLYLIKDKKNDILILTGDAQAVTPEGQYDVNQKIMNFFQNKLKGKFVYTIGGYSVGEAAIKSPRVFGNATSKEVIDSFKGSDVVFGRSRGIIWGSAGLLIGFAKMNKLDGICLMGETSFLEVDASAAKAVIVTLSKRLGLSVDTANLDKIINKTAKMLMELEKQAGVGQPQFPPQQGEGSESERPSYIR